MLIRLFSLSMAVLVGMIALSILREQQPIWKDFQHKYQEMLSKDAKTTPDKEAANAFPIQVRQVLAEDLTILDRCQTCHLGVDDPGMVDEVEPFTTHPDIPEHSFDRFGCATCHQGQPWGTTVETAHGEVAFWHQPLLGRNVIEASCGRCHPETTLPGAPLLSQGRKLMQTLGCEECHQVNGLGGNTAPDLTTVGSKYAVSYLRESIVDPKANDTSSMMPDFKLPKEDVQALIVAMLALTDHRYPRELSPKTERAEQLYSAVYRSDTISTGGRLFQTLGCFHCHKTGEIGKAYAKDLSGIGREQDAYDILELMKSPGFDSTHQTLSTTNIRPVQLQLISEYLEQFREEVVVAVAKQQPVTAASSVVVKSSGATTPAVAQVPAPKVDPKALELGKKLYKEKNCKMCHKLNRAGGTIGPKLDKVGSKRDAEWLFYHFKDPQSLSPGTRMPNYNFSDKNAEALTAFMQTLR